MSEQKKTRVGPLATIGNCATEIARVYRQMVSGKLDGKEGERRARVLTMLRQSLEVGSIEERLDRLEQEQKR
ncbi:hypothetical protein GOB46_15870 [Sinorhizobium meliloti]|uniref:hypothetical protein n=1 Tax=Rhizobium meliloti TaxID=382 RepID=UPI0002861321|nr:hypothetical protein [Sinorhizobium meliloti]PII39616.1 hypothetical protein T190_02025 [Sinorhizobium meliloti CCBAU 01290]ASP79332.1 hypothetical protein CDO27_15985 [Sinorhizobium meliloti]MCO6422234.1 hypothetical protein [Sinorhizobium meliloti]MDE3811583.1 hypothetical protein [Sinorhizobium meliloti]MDE3818768.1 hypothetical protein [Sinorhizobium meliloti]